MSDNNYIGNISTLGKFIATAIAGWVIALATANGLNLGINEVTLAELIGVLIGLGYGYIDAKYPNTFNWLKNAPIDSSDFDDMLDVEDELINIYEDEDGDGGA